MMNMPADAAGMKKHLAAAPPDGHGMPAADMPMDMPMADCVKQHDAMHAAGAGHTHPPDMNARIRQATGR